MQRIDWAFSSFPHRWVWAARLSGVWNSVKLHKKHKIFQHKKHSPKVARFSWVSFRDLTSCSFSTARFCLVPANALGGTLFRMGAVAMGVLLMALLKVEDEEDELFRPTEWKDREVWDNDHQILHSLTVIDLNLRPNTGPRTQSFYFMKWGVSLQREATVRIWE